MCDIEIVRLSNFSLIELNEFIDDLELNLMASDSCRGGDRLNFHVCNNDNNVSDRLIKKLYILSFEGKIKNINFQECYCDEEEG